MTEPGKVPGFTPRTEEWQPVAAMLEGGTYDSPQSLAKAVVRHAYASLLLRDWYIALVRLEPFGGIAYGLCATPAAAEAVELGSNLPRAVVKVSSATGHLEHVHREGW